MLPSPARIHVVFKTHLDVGFTDFAGAVVRNYFEAYIPRAIELARHLRVSNAPQRFIWTTGSWLIYEYLENAAPDERKAMETAILAGDITWHALPFTLHSENLDPSLFRFGLSLSRKLDARFGKTTIAAKMTDVPGHTRGIVPLLAEAGVQFLHIGVNESSTAPDVPDVFNWQSPDGASVTVMYHKSGYGDLMLVRGLEDAIYFAHTGDNLGPQEPEELGDVFSVLRRRFPQAQVQASTLDAFAARLGAIRAELPTVTAELGDTWIHGVGSDPAKESAYRALLRLRRDWLEQGRATEDELEGFSRRLLCVPEHTWGLDVKTHLHDWENWSNEKFTGVRHSLPYRKMEASWQEQRAYLAQAVYALPTPALREQAHAAQNATLPEPFALREHFEPLPNPSDPLPAGRYAAALHPINGALCLLTGDGGQVLAAPDALLGLFCYQTFSAADYARFYHAYSRNKRQTAIWALPDFTKPNLSSAGAQSQMITPVMTFAGHMSDSAADHLLAVLSLPEDAVRDYGAPREVTLHYTFPRDRAEIQIALRWHGKTSTRLPEALWLSFNPPKLNPTRWQMRKLGQWVAPRDVIRNGNRHLHAVDAVRNGSWRLETLDAPLFAPGQRALVDFSNRQPDLRGGLHFNLYNNQWGTNFPMWYDEDGLARFILTPQTGA